MVAFVASLHSLHSLPRVGGGVGSNAMQRKRISGGEHRGSGVDSNRLPTPLVLPTPFELLAVTPPCPSTARHADTYFRLAHWPRCSNPSSPICVSSRLSRSREANCFR